ncbi:hypothetical protein HLRTI_003101 [Halorhabdus tiamatea SARL4B]|uniref:Uncharacterized protein n=1 Tax=Halorhabdus tiamatea SARL4B TaxID=1033806 RepID=U2DYQ7_9EURY|nr:hypothetical protein HLRTI_003101 [Halorhabdus tiamatea SARL4B]
MAVRVKVNEEHIVILCGQLSSEVDSDRRFADASLQHTYRNSPRVPIGLYRIIWAIRAIRPIYAILAI